MELMEAIIFRPQLNFTLRFRRCSENAFGIMASRWRILRRAINLKPENCDNVVMACIVLHNFLMRKSMNQGDSIYCPRGYSDTVLPDGSVTDGDWRNEDSSLRNMDSCFSRNFSRNAEAIRQSFVHYVNTVGAVSWQNEFAHVF